MPRMTIEVLVARPPAEVLDWWTGFPDDYRAADPREQPHRIRVVARAPARLDLRTYWRVPLLGEVMIPETMHLVSASRFEVDVHFPLGLAQHDTFTLRGEDAGTRVTIELELSPRNLLGRVIAPLYWNLYGRRMYPRTFRHAGRLCARDAPRSAGPAHGASSPA